MSSRLTRRDLLLLGCGVSTLSFVPGLIPAAMAQSQSREKPRIRSVVRLQMYAGWDVVMSINPPAANRHRLTAEGLTAWLMHWNYPSGTPVPRGDFRFADASNASVKQADAMEKQVKNTLGTDFFNRLDRGIRLKSGSNFVPIAGEVGLSGVPFAQLGSDTTWVKTSPNNPSIRVGPLMHRFVQPFDRDPANPAVAIADSYCDQMTIINGIDTARNVSHDAGAVLAATGFTPPGVGNGADISTLAFNPSFEALMAGQIVERGSTLLPTGTIGSPLVPLLTFSYPGFRRGYVRGEVGGRAPLFDVKSLKDLDQKTSLVPPTALTANKTELAARLQGKAAANGLVRESFDSFSEILRTGSLGFGDYETPERQAFDGMVEVLLDKADTNSTEDRAPPVRLKQTGMAAGNAMWRSADPAALRQSVTNSAEGSYQANLATAAMLVRKGYTRGISVSFGGHVNFIPDTHVHNDYVQTIYQGIFSDGVRRFLNYLRWNKDSEGRPLLDTTLVIVTGDITRGPVFFDQNSNGKSDFRNNSMALFGGGLWHKTRTSAGGELPGRVIGYSYGGLESARIDLSNGAPIAPEAPGDKASQAITYSRIYASLCECYGVDVERYYAGVTKIATLSKNEAGAPSEDV